MTSDVKTDLGVAFENVPFRSSLFNAMDKVHLTNESGGDIVTGDVMSLDLAHDESCVDASSAAPYLPAFVVPYDVSSVGIASSKTIVDGEDGWMYHQGAYCPAAAVDGAVAVGEYLCYSSTAKKFTGTNAVQGTSPPPLHAKAVALAAATVSGLIPVMLLHEPANQSLACMVHNNADIAITASTLTALTFNTDDHDPDDMHDTVTNSNRITVPADFIGTSDFIISCCLAWSASPAGFYATIRLNGTTEIARHVGCVKQYMGFSTNYKLSAEDYVELLVYTTTGSLSVKYYDGYSPVLRVAGGW